MSQAQDNKKNEFEKYLKNMDDIKQKCVDSTSANVDECKALLTELTSSNSLKAISNEYADMKTQSSYDTKQNLADKKTSIKIFQKETKNLKDHIKNIKQEKQNKQRLVEASEWEYDRYTAHIYVFKMIFASLVLIGLILFVKQKTNAVPNVISFGLIVIIVSIMLYNVMYEIITNMRRNKFDYDKFDQTYDKRFNVSDSGLGKHEQKDKYGVFRKLVCESFANGNEDSLNGHNYSFIN